MIIAVVYFLIKNKNLFDKIIILLVKDLESMDRWYLV